MSTAYTFTPESIAQAQKAQFESFLAFSQTVLASTERFAALQLSATRSLLEDSSTAAQSLLAAKDLPDFISIQSQLAQPATDKALALSRSFYELGNASREELTKTLEAKFAEAGNAIYLTLDQIEKSALPGSEPVVSASISAFKSALSAATTAYDNLNATLRQTADYAATASPVKAAAKAKKS